MKYIHYLSSFLKHLYFIAALYIAVMFCAANSAYQQAMFTVTKAQAMAVLEYLTKMNGV